MKTLKSLSLATLILLALGTAAPLFAEAGLLTDVKDTISTLKQTDPGTKRLFETAQGYVVFPSIAKGGFIVAGSRGTGLVYEGGELIGKATLTSASVGAQAGGQVFSEVIFFESRSALNNFKQSGFSMNAQVSAVVAASGAAKKARYNQGVMVFLLPKEGLMVAASIGGQKFKFTPYTR